MDACGSERRRRGLSLQDVSESSGGFNFCAEFTKVKEFMLPKPRSYFIVSEWGLFNFFGDYICLRATI